MNRLKYSSSLTMCKFHLVVNFHKVLIYTVLDESNGFFNSFKTEFRKSGGIQPEDGIGIMFDATSC